MLAFLSLIPLQSIGERRGPPRTRPWRVPWAALGCAGTGERDGWFVGIYEGDSSIWPRGEIEFLKSVHYVKVWAVLGPLCLAMDMPAFERNDYDFPHCCNWFLCYHVMPRFRPAEAR